MKYLIGAIVGVISLFLFSFLSGNCAYPAGLLLVCAWF